MTLPLPTVVDDPKVQQVLDVLARAFPINSENLGKGSVGSVQIEDGAILNVDVNAAAAIAYSKLKLAASVKGTDLVEGTVEDKRLAKPVIVGQVSAAGAVLAGEGFTSEKSSTGVYVIKLTTELGTTGIIQMTPKGSNVFPSVVTDGKKEFKVQFVSGAAALTDTIFNFEIKAS